MKSRNLSSEKNTLPAITRRTFVTAVASVVGASAWASTPPKTKVEVWKDPDCGCCKDWVLHLEKSGFEVRVFDTGNTEKRAQLGIPQKLGSCHTALVAGYAIEGHVPAKDIQRLLREKPNALGLTVPGMPVGSPGMDGAEYQGRKDPYSVLLMAKNGSATVYQSYR
jgi:hypothetical protein